MRSAKILGVLIGSCAVVTGMWAFSRSVSANSTVSDSIVKWEYAQLYVGKDKTVLMEATRESVVTPPSDQPDSNSNEFHTGPNSARYVLDSKATRNNTIGVLNLLGSAGWEVVSNTPSGTGTLILLKHSY